MTCWPYLLTIAYVLCEQWNDGPAIQWAGPVRFESDDQGSGSAQGAVGFVPFFNSSSSFWAISSAPFSAALRSGLLSFAMIWSSAATCATFNACSAGTFTSGSTPVPSQLVLLMGLIARPL